MGPRRWRCGNFWRILGFIKGGTRRFDMSISRKRFSWILCVATMAALPLFAQQQQQSPAPPSGSGSQAQAPAPPVGRGACWKQAGIPRSTIRQRRAIFAGERNQIQSVRGDSNLTPQQQAARITEIRQKSKAQLDSLITPEQRHALGQCHRAQRAAQHQSEGTKSNPGEPQSPAAAPSDAPKSQPN
jgi:hypothetical protein